MPILTTLKRLICLERYKRTLLTEKHLARLDQLLALQERIIAKFYQKYTPSSSTPPLSQLKALLERYQHEKSCTATLLNDMHLICQKYFYTPSPLYTHTGKSHSHIVKHYSQSI